MKQEAASTNGPDSTTKEKLRPEKIIMPCEKNGARGENLESLDGECLEKQIPLAKNRQSDDLGLKFCGCSLRCDGFLGRGEIPRLSAAKDAAARSL